MVWVGAMEAEQAVGPWLENGGIWWAEFSYG